LPAQKIALWLVILYGRCEQKQVVDYSSKRIPRRYSTVCFESLFNLKFMESKNPAGDMEQEGYQFSAQIELPVRRDNYLKK